MKKSVLFVILFAVMAILIAQNAYSIAISGCSGKFRYVPGQDIVIGCTLFNSYGEDMDAFLSFGADNERSAPEAYKEDLEKVVPYIEVDPKSVTIKPNERKSVTVKIKLPKNLEEPGLHYLFVQAVEGMAGYATIGATAAVRKLITVEVLHPDTYLTFKLDSTNPKEGDPVNFTIETTNKGKKPATDVYADITIYDPSNRSVGSVRTSKIGYLASFESGKMDARWDSTGNPAGKYRWSATIYSNAGVAQRESFFRIGTLNIEILNFTRIFPVGKINPLDIDIESRWNEQFSNVYAKVDIKDGHGRVITSFNTPAYTINAFERRNMTSYFDTSKVGMGQYPATVTLFYAGRTSVKNDIVTVIPDMGFVLNINWVWVMLVLLMIIINVLLILLLKKKDDSDDKKKKAEKEAPKKQSPGLIGAILDKAASIIPKKKQEAKREQKDVRVDKEKDANSDLFDIFNKK